MVFLVMLTVVLAALLAYEVPHLLKRSEASSPTADSGPSGAGPAARQGARSLHGGRVGADPFVAKAIQNGDARAVVGGGGDPFTGRGPAAPLTAPRPLPGQIVIGRPGGDRVATHGWIVILASIPSGSGRGSAALFARSARAKVGPLSILNSSHRRPLRGGYWVVYSGPYGSLAAVSRRADSIHATGYGTAYIRELITYR
jgi:hypothetical protein